MPEALSMPWIVQKYGGTSIGKLLPSIADAIIPSYLTSRKIAIVCSARSGTTKSEGTTSLLLDAIRLATSSEIDIGALDGVINVIQAAHLLAAKTAIGEHGSEALLKETKVAVKRDCEQLRSTLNATWTLGEISDRTTDRVLSIGEVLACRIVSGSLRAKGIPSDVVILDDIVQEAYGRNHRSLSQAFKASPASFLRTLTDAIRPKILACGNKVPVITGFFGAMPDSLLYSIGRGYSDLCAALCAVALDAEELQIWKEVDGIFTADPRKIKAARLLATITSEEASELTYYGSEVIHPLTIEQVDNAGIPLRLKNVMNPGGTGTIIFPSIQPVTPNLENDTNAKLSFMTTHGYYGPSSYRRSPTAVTAKEDISVLIVRSNGTTSPSTFFSSISNTVESHGITIDLISSSQQMLSLAVCCSKPANLNEAMAEMKGLGAVSVIPDMSIVSIVGHKMRNMVGTAAEIFGALSSARVNIYLISQGASEINISFVVKARDAQTAIEVVHTNVMRIPLYEESVNAFVKGPWLY